MTLQKAPSRSALADLLGERLTGAPFESVMSFTVAMAWAFYRAERGRNPRVRTYWDAFHYVATSLSVGYANLFPVTDRGKVIASLVMIVGPALSAGALDGARAPRAAQATPVEPELAAKLDAILTELRAIRGALPAAARG